MKKIETFYIATNEGLKKVEGERITIEGVECFLHKYNRCIWWPNDYRISDLKTGLNISYNKKKQLAIDTAQFLILSNPVKPFMKGKNILKKNGFKYPVNK